MTFDDLNKKIIESVGLKVDEGGYILTAKGSNLVKDGLKLVIPTKANVNNQNEIVDGLVKPKYMLFNPYSEDDLKRNQILVLLMKYMSAISTSGILSGILSQLTVLLSTEEVQDSVSTHVKNFIIKLREINGNRGVLMSKKRSADMNKIVNYLLENNLFIIDYKMARGETINGIKYTRVAKLDPKAIETVEEKFTEMGVDEKSKTIFLEIINFIIPNIKDKVVGSTSSRYPSIISAVSLYNEIQTRINYLLEDMKDVLASPYEELTMPLLESVDLEKYKASIEFLPNANKLEDSSPSNMLSSLQDKVSTAPISVGGVVSNNINTVNLDNSIVLPKEEEMDGFDSFKASLMGSSSDHGFINRYNSQVLYSGMQQKMQPTIENYMNQQAMQANNPFNVGVGNPFNLGNTSKWG